MKSWPPGVLPLAARTSRLKGQGRFVAVVAVGDDQRCCSYSASDGVDEVRIIRDPELVAHAVVVVGVRHGRGLTRIEGSGQTFGQREAPDGGEVGPGGTQQVKAIALRFGQRLFVGQHVGFVARPL